MPAMPKVMIRPVASRIITPTGRVRKQFCRDSTCAPKATSPPVPPAASNAFPSVSESALHAASWGAVVVDVPPGPSGGLALVVGDAFFVGTPEQPIIAVIRSSAAARRTTIP